MASASGLGLRGAGGPGFDLVSRARDTIVRHDMLQGREVVVVAVSGGPDSTCLLDVLLRLSELDLELVVAHVDHGLSDDSRGVAECVERTAADAGIDFFQKRACDLAGPNLHARARQVRYQFFAGVAERVGARRIATGHTLDDRVETLLARLLHGGTTQALASIPPAAGPRIRPLIEVRRKETEAYCRACSLDFHVDPSNDDLRFDRARVRNSLLVAIEDGWGAGSVVAIATAAERLREDADALSAMAEDLLGDLTTIEDDRTVINRRALMELPRALRRRVLELALGRLRDRSKAIDATLDALEGDPPPGSRFAVAGGAEIVIQRDTIQIHPAF